MFTKAKAIVRSRKIFIILTIVVLLLLTGSAVLGGEDIYIESNIAIDRSAEDVWAFTSEPTNATLWIDGLRENVITSGSGIGVGTTGRQVVETLGVRNESEWVIIDYVPDSSLTYEVTSGPLTGLQVVESVEPSDNGGTLFSYTASGSVEGFPGLPNEIAAYMFEMQLANDFYSLKSLLEATVTPEPSPEPSPEPTEEPWPPTEEPSPEPTVEPSAIP